MDEDVKNSKIDGQETENSDDVVIERDENLDDSVLAEESAGEMVKKLREKLKKCQTEKEEYLSGWQRERADFVNARKRDKTDMEEFRKFASSGLIEELLPVLQSFEMAFSNKEAWEKADKNWRVGIEYIHSQLNTILKEHGLIEINPVGKNFDPSIHEPAEYVKVGNEKEAGKILEVVQKGYSLNGKIIRPPKVKIGEIDNLYGKK